MAIRTLHLVGIAGSLRKGSLNRALLRAVAELVPEEVDFEILDLASIPLYDADLDEDARRPEPVQRLKEAIAGADGLVLATPEYNFGVPGVLKNALDWASRPAYRSPMTGRPVALMGAAPGASGTMRAQEQLKLSLMAMASAVFPHRGVAITRARERFDDELHLVDEATRDYLRSYLHDFTAWVRRHGDSS